MKKNTNKQKASQPTKQLKVKSQLKAGQYLGKPKNPNKFLGDWIRYN